MDWGGADLGRGEGVHETLAPASAVHLRPPTPRGLQVGPAEVPMRTGPDPGLPATSSPSSFLPSLLPRAGPETKLPSGWGGGEWRWRGQSPGPRSQVPARCLSWAGALVHCARTEEQGRRRPKPAGLYAPPCCAAAQPPLPNCHPLIHPTPHICTPKYTQESHQLLPLSRGPAAPRASLDGSRAAVSSSSSSSSSSPSVNSSWLRP